MYKKDPKPPPGWNKTISDLFNEMDRGERTSVGFPESKWAEAYERSLIPSGIRFPRKGDVYEALSDIEVSYMTSWKAPYTLGGKSVLKKGDKVSIDHAPPVSKPISVYAKAVNYNEIEERIIPSSDRNSPKYNGYYFSFNTVDLNKSFKLIKEDTRCEFIIRNIKPIIIKILKL